MSDPGATLPPPGAGPRVGPWELGEALGRGGMGVVLRARHLVTGAQAAVKLIPLREREERARFLREVQAMGRVRHPGVLPVLDAGELEGRAWLATPLILGGSLQDRLARQGPLPPAEALRLGRALAEALAAAHAAGVLHRDLKPANVLLEADGRPVLADIGLTRLADSASLTATGTVMGTPAFMAPEQAEGQRVDARADVYGLGAILYAALSGVGPFRASGPVQLLRAVLEDAPAPIPGLEPRLEALVLRCLAKDPAQRPQTAAALGAELAALAQGAAPPASAPRPRSLAAALVVAAALASVGLVALAPRTREAGSPSPSPVASQALPAALLRQARERDLELDFAAARGLAEQARDAAWQSGDHPLAYEAALLAAELAPSIEEGLKALRAAGEFGPRRGRHLAQLALLLDMAGEGPALAEEAWARDPEDLVVALAHARLLMEAQASPDQDSTVPLQAARQALEALARREPDDPRAWALLAVLYPVVWEAGLGAEAEQRARDCFARLEPYATLLARARAAAQSGDLARAGPTVRRVRLALPGHPDALALLARTSGWELERNPSPRRLAELLAATDCALELAPEAPEELVAPLTRLLGRVLELRDDSELRRLLASQEDIRLLPRSLAQAAERTRHPELEALAILSRALLLGEEPSESERATLAELTTLGSPARAALQELIRRVLGRAPSGSGPDAPRSSGQLLALAMRSYEEGRFPAALQAARDAARIARALGDTDTAYEAALLAVELGDPGKQLAGYQELERVGRRTRGRHLALAALRIPYRDRDWPNATPWTEEAWRREPSDPAVILAWSSLLRDRGNDQRQAEPEAGEELLRQARTLLEGLTRSHPDEPEAWNLLAWVCRDLRDRPPEFAAYQQAWDGYGSLEPYASLLRAAEQALQAGDPRQALDLATRVFGARPRHPQARALITRLATPARLEQGDLAMALGELKETVSLNPYTAPELREALTLALQAVLAAGPDALPSLWDDDYPAPRNLPDALRKASQVLAVHRQPELTLELDVLTDYAASLLKPNLGERGAATHRLQVRFEDPSTPPALRELLRRRLPVEGPAPTPEDPATAR